MNLLKKIKKQNKIRSYILFMSRIIQSQILISMTTMSLKLNFSLVKNVDLFFSSFSITGVFLFCWLPFFSCNIMDAMCSKFDKDCSPGVTAFIFTTWLGYINSFVNPVIYTIFNPEFRKAFKKIMHIGWLKFKTIIITTRRKYKLKHNIAIFYITYKNRQDGLLLRYISI